MPRLSAHTRAALRTASLTVLGVGGISVAAIIVTDGEDTKHVHFHMIFGLVTALAATGVWWLWRPRPSVLERGARLAVVAALCILAASFLLEGIVRSASGASTASPTSVTQPLILVVPVTLLLAVLALLLRLGSFILGKVSSNRGSQAPG